MVTLETIPSPAAAGKRQCEGAPVQPAGGHSNLPHPMRFRTALLLAGTLALSGCGDSTGSASAAEIEVVFVNRTLFVGAFPAFVFTVENRGRAAVESVRFDLDAIRGGTTVTTTVATVDDLGPGEQAESTPAVLAELDSHADYECYRYRVRAYDADADLLSDESSGQVCP